MFRYPDTDFERSFYRDVFSDEMDGEDVARDVDWDLDPEDRLLQTLDPVGAGVSH